MLKGNKVRLVLISVSTDCWAKNPHNTAKAAQNKKVDPFIMFKKVFKSSKLSTSGIYPMTDITASEEKDRHDNNKSCF